MELMDFMCHEDGLVNKKPVKIKIPTSCCGVKLKVVRNPVGADMFAALACDHFGTYPNVWGIWLTIRNTLDTPVKYGYSCSKCREYNYYAAANQPDGTFICYMCR
jgi:hypothetical protein